MHILGINCVYHESSVCLIKDGKIVTVIEEERLNRIKHAKNALPENTDILPMLSLRHVFDDIGVRWKDIAYIGFSFDIEQQKQICEDRAKGKRNDPVAPKNYYQDLDGDLEVYRRLHVIPEKLAQISGMTLNHKFKWIPHHICHASSAYHVSPYDDAAVLSIDGMGELASTLLGYGKKNKLETIKEIDYPHSLGLFWEVLCKHLGFSVYDAAKVMGLAAYGDPKVYESEFKEMVSVDESGDFRMLPEAVSFVTTNSLLEQLLGSSRRMTDKVEDRHYNIAAALQRLTETIMLRLTSYLYEKTKSENLCIAGGVGLNCVANGLLQEKSPFKHIYVQPASHDAGTAIGAAYYIWNNLLDKPRSYVLDSPYFGPEYSEKELENVIKENRLHYEYHQEIEPVVASLIAEKNIVSWFQGKMELGPRALGNRSFVCDPRDWKMREYLNAKVKHREYFRPLAPAVLEEKSGEWFKIPNNCESMSTRFMLFTYQALDEKKHKIPAVIHHDGTSRVQTVSKHITPKFHKLISEFDKITGVPMVLNTSFNDQEPIVCSPQDAINTFKKTFIDYLVLGNFLISRKKDNALPI